MFSIIQGHGERPISCSVLSALWWCDIFPDANRGAADHNTLKHKGRPLTIQAVSGNFDVKKKKIHVFFIQVIR